MGVKDTVRALLDRLPEDCKLSEVIDELCRLEVAHPEPEDVPLSRAQSEALDAELERLELEPDGGVPWREVLARIRRGQ